MHRVWAASISTCSHAGLCGRGLVSAGARAGAESSVRTFVTGGAPLGRRGAASSSWQPRAPHHVQVRGVGEWGPASRPWASREGLRLVNAAGMVGVPLAAFFFLFSDDEEPGGTPHRPSGIGSGTGSGMGEGYLRRAADVAAVHEAHAEGRDVYEGDAHPFLAPSSLHQGPARTSPTPLKAAQQQQQGGRGHEVQVQAQGQGQGQGPATASLASIDSIGAMRFRTASDRRRRVYLAQRSSRAAANRRAANEAATADPGAAAAAFADAAAASVQARGGSVREMSRAAASARAVALSEASMPLPEDPRLRAAELQRRRDLLRLPAWQLQQRAEAMAAPARAAEAARQQQQLDDAVASGRRAL